MYSDAISEYGRTTWGDCLSALSDFYSDDRQKDGMLCKPLALAPLRGAKNHKHETFPSENKRPRPLVMKSFEAVNRKPKTSEPKADCSVSELDDALSALLKSNSMLSEMF